MVKIHKYKPTVNKGWFKYCYCSSRKIANYRYQQEINMGVPFNLLFIQRCGNLSSKIPYIIWKRDIYNHLSKPKDL
jgi:hypothetical protein